MWTKAFIRGVLEKPEGMTAGKHQNRYLIYRMLQALYERQTSSEQASQQTQVLNGVGFNGADARLLSKVAIQSKPYNNLTVKQAVMVAKRLKKYAGQLETIAAEKSKLVVVPPVQLFCLECGGPQHQQIEDCDVYWAKLEQQREKEQEAAAFLSKAAGW